MTDTERIDLDEFDSGSSEDETEDSERGDWLSSEAGSHPPFESSPSFEMNTDPDPESETHRVDPDSGPATPASESTETDSHTGPIPHVPRPNDDKPVGIPVDRGGAGAGPAAGPANASSGSVGDEEVSGRTVDEEPAGPRPMGSAGYHDTDVDDMTMAITYNAVRQLEDPALALATAREWADWIGIVGDVPAHRINTFQRKNRIDADFFNGSGTGPGERLVSIDGNSMFFADRLVVVGVAGKDDEIARTADWEFVPLSEAAEKANWERISD